jgi:hypothetical protein
MELKEQFATQKLKASPATPWFRIGLMATVLTAAIMLLSLPNRTIVQTPESVPDRDGNLKFSGVETHPDGYKFAWATPESALVYADAPRYAPLNLTLRLNLQRPPDVPPAQIEVYERPADPTEDDATVEGQEQQVAVLIFDPSKTGPQDYSFTLPPRAHGDGVYITFKSNTFQVPGDRRELSFMFLRAELKLGPGHLRYLVWPHLYFPAVLIFLAAVVAWGWRVGLGWITNLVFSGQLAYVLMMAAPSTWRISWLMLILALAIWGCYFWAEFNRRRASSEIIALFAACAVVVSLFLLTNDEVKRDIQFYIDWSRAIHDYGIWNVYSHDATLNYLPLIIYLLWFYNLLAYPLGFHDSLLAWRITASLLFLVCLGLLYLFAKNIKKDFTTEATEEHRGVLKSEVRSQKSEGCEPDTRHPTPDTPNSKLGTRNSELTRMLLLVGFNVSIFYNPAVWGQSDIIPALLLVLSFYLIYRKQPYLAGFALALTAISKPQAWFVLPLGLLLLPKLVGWKRGILGMLPGVGVVLVMSLAAFGLSWDSFSRYWNQGQLAGDFRYQFPTAYNLSFLLIDPNIEPPNWITGLGFGLVGLVMVGVAWKVLRGATRPGDSSLATGLMNTACFTFLIKMKERYLVYGMPLMGLGVYYDRKLLKPFLALSWLQLLNLSILMFQTERFRLQTLPENFYLWSSLLSQQWFRKSIAVAFILMIVYMGWLYWFDKGKKEPYTEPQRPKENGEG